MKKRGVEAFVTIEYSLLLPGILLLFTCLVCVGLYMHNQCVLQINTYMLSIEGAGENADTVEKRMELLQEEMSTFSHKYILAEDMEVTYKLQGNKIIVSSIGYMATPFSALEIGTERWKLGAESVFYISNPADTLRLIKKVRGILVNAPTEGEYEDDS